MPAASSEARTTPEAAVVTIVDAATLALATTGVVAAIYAIRRDRPNVVLRYHDVAMGTSFLSIVNAGLRSVRIVRVHCRPHRWRRGGELDLTASIYTADVETPAPALPVVLQPGEELIV